MSTYDGKDRRKNPWIKVKAEECLPDENEGCYLEHPAANGAGRWTGEEWVWEDTAREMCGEPTQWAYTPKGVILETVTLDFHAIQPPDNAPEPSEEQLYNVKSEDKEISVLLYKRRGSSCIWIWQSGDFFTREVIAYMPIPPRKAGET